MNTIHYIKENCWCNFKNNNRTLFYRTIYHYGVVKYKNPLIENEVTETITIYYPKNTKQVHAFNGNEPAIHKNSLQKISIQEIPKLINQYNKIKEKIDKISNTIDVKNLFANSPKIKEIIELEAKLYAYEYFISNLSNHKQEEMNSNIYQKFIKWKNNPNNKEPWIYHQIFKKLLDYYPIDIEVSTFKRYISRMEFIEILDKKRNIYKMVEIIKKREKYGFILLNLNHKNYQNKIITNHTIVKSIRSHIENLTLQELTPNQTTIDGKPTYPFNTIDGKCIVIQNNDFDNVDIFNKIVVCSILTAQDTIKLLDCRAILVEYGGYLSHASIWSREYQKPCFVGCTNITKILKNDDSVIIDGKKGIITIIRKD